MKVNASWRAALAGAAVNLVVGANLPYLPVWMEKVAGMSGAEIAGASTLAILLRIIAGPLAGTLASDHGLRATLASVMTIALAGYLLLFPESPRSLDFFLCVLIYSALNVAGPLFEAMLVYGTREGRPDYGQARAIASAAFVLANLAGGAMLALTGPDWLLAYLVGAGALAALAPLLTRQGARASVTRGGLVSTFREAFALYRIRGLFIFLLAAALVQASHGAYYAFASNIWIRQDIEGHHIGALWATGVGAEIIILLISGHLLRRLSPYSLLWLGCFGAVIRWSAAGFILPVEAVYVLQTLHAASFALTHLATMNLLRQSLPEEKLPLAYSANGALIFGPAMAVTGLAAGLSYDLLAPGGISAQTQLYWLMAAIAALATGLTWHAQRRPARPATG